MAKTAIPERGMDRRKLTLVFLFACSGFSALIYESIWTHYLKLFLGHAAYAQALVLAIFMGAMAIGSLICSRSSHRWRSPLKGYALAEGAIGVAALLFHFTFETVLSFSYSAVLPQLASPMAINIYKWSVSTVMILPQSILLGMTFPLMTAAVVRMEQEGEKETSVATLYAANSFGAVAGVIVNGFVLVHYLGLPGSMMLAGALNIAVALVVLAVVRRGENAGAQYPEAGTGNGSRPAFFLLIAALTGFASFVYEIGWIRMLSLVLGSSTHSFELMLAAFILGLACGGLWIKRRMHKIAHAARFLAIMQVVMGLCALATLPLYGTTFYVMEWLMALLPKSAEGYITFNLAGHALSLAIMVPATFCAGTTLPLLTATLFRNGWGERSIGAVYGANTLGAIAGVFFAVHLGLPLLGLKGLLIAGAAVDLALGVALAWRFARGSAISPALTTAVAAAALLGCAFFVHLDPYRMASGVYRHGKLLSPDTGRILYHEDGKTATISVSSSGNGSLMSIHTNGKVDASMKMTPGKGPSTDELTMVLLGVLPMASHPTASDAAVIGFGAGTTTKVLLDWERLKTVDTIEIEPKMIEAAKLFGSRISRGYTDPRSRIYIDDAKTFFATHRKKYDIIVAAPSNPWVSGVASLFTTEFYRLVRGNLNENGVFAQWLQLYEINDRLVASIFKSLRENFSDFAVYYASDRDIVVLCKNQGRLGRLDPSVFDSRDVSSDLWWIGVNGIQDLRVRRLGDRKMLSPFIDSFNIRANSDYYPVLDQEAVRSRFLEESAWRIASLSLESLPLTLFLDQEGHDPLGHAVTPTNLFERSLRTARAVAFHDYLLTGKMPPEVRGDQPNFDDAVSMRKLFIAPGEIPEPARTGLLFKAGKSLLMYYSPTELTALWRTLKERATARQLSPLDHEYLALFEALNVRDTEGVLQAVHYLLVNEKEMPVERRSYVVAAGMLSYLARGDRAGAEALFAGQRETLFGNGALSPIFVFLGGMGGTVE